MATIRPMIRPCLCMLSAAFLLFPVAGTAGEADVVVAKAGRDSAGRWTISATVSHADEGWNHYADRFEVLAPDGRILATRVLAHPHVEEQPFTRLLGGAAIPDSIRDVAIRAHDSVHGYGGKTVRIRLSD